MKFRIRNLKRNSISILISFSVSLIVFSGFYTLQKKDVLAKSNTDRFVALNNLTTASSDIENEIKSAISYTDFFSLIISQNPNIKAKQLETFSSLALVNNKNIKSVQFAPNAIVKIVYPLKENQAALNHDLLNDPDRKIYAQKAIEKRVSVLQGPVLAKQGGYLLFNRKAIFYEENSIEKFWGLAVVAIDFEQIIESFRTKINSDKYDIAIRIKDEKSVEYIFGDESIFSKDSITRTIIFPEKNWEMALYPKSTWLDEQSIFKQINILYYFITLFIFTLLFFVIKNYTKNIDNAKKDPLTKTLNISSITKRINRMILAKKPFVFVVIDVNGFKGINDNLGHYIGDCVLIEISNSFTNILREKDYISRSGGDEFIICLDDSHSEILLSDILNRLKDEARKTIEIENYLLEISISIGYAQFPKDAKTFNDLYQLADKNMYQNKQDNKEDKSKYKLI